MEAIKTTGKFKIMSIELNCLWSSGTCFNIIIADNAICVTGRVITDDARHEFCRCDTGKEDKDVVVVMEEVKIR